jgi:type IV pilus assembly protein PilB
MVLKNKKLEDMLLGLGLITQEQLLELQQEVAETQHSVQQVMLDKGWVSEEILAKTQAILWDVPFISLKRAKIPNDVLSIIPERVSKTYEVVAFNTSDDGRLRVAMTNPTDFQAIEFLEKKTSRIIEPYMALKSEILHVQDQYRALASEVTKALADVDEGSVSITTEAATQGLTEEEGEGDDLNGAPVARVVNTIMEYAVKSKASDIHIEPMEEKTRIRYRVDGILQEALTVPKQVHPAIISRIKIMARMKIDEKRIPQDGRFRVTVHDKEADLRVSTLPTIFGEKIVMRILDRSTSAPTLEQLGYRGRGLQILKNNMTRPNGLILTTGPTGSGKSTSLFSILTQLNTGTVNTITLEDPVEYWITGVNQVQINVQAGLTFASGLRSVLRQDPNIVMVGEIRDEETAEMAIHAALTGHLVVSTLHTNNATGAIPRFLDMGAEPFLLASSLRVVIGQRLVRKVCSECFEAFEAPPEVADEVRAVLSDVLTGDEDSHRQLIVDYPKLPKKIFDSKHAIELVRGAGCEACGQTGYQGRLGIYEVMEVTEDIVSLILKRSSGMDIEKVAKGNNHMITIIQDAFLKALEGRTTLEEAMRIAAD